MPLFTLCYTRKKCAETLLDQFQSSTREKLRFTNIPLEKNGMIAPYGKKERPDGTPAEKGENPGKDGRTGVFKGRFKNLLLIVSAHVVVNLTPGKRLQ